MMGKLTESVLLGQISNAGLSEYAGSLFQQMFLYDAARRLNGTLPAPEPMLARRQFVSRDQVKALLAKTAR